MAEAKQSPALVVDLHVPVDFADLWKNIKPLLGWSADQVKSVADYPTDHVLIAYSKAAADALTGLSGWVVTDQKGAHPIQVRQVHIPGQLGPDKIPRRPGWLLVTSDSDMSKQWLLTVTRLLSPYIKYLPKATIKDIKPISDRAAQVELNSDDDVKVVISLYTFAPAESKTPGNQIQPLYDNIPPTAITSPTAEITITTRPVWIAATNEVPKEFMAEYLNTGISTIGDYKPLAYFPELNLIVDELRNEAFMEFRYGLPKLSIPMDIAKYTDRERSLHTPSLVITTIPSYTIALSPDLPLPTAKLVISPGRQTWQLDQVAPNLTKIIATAQIPPDSAKPDWAVTSVVPDLSLPGNYQVQFNNEAAVEPLIGYLNFMGDVRARYQL